MMRLASGVGGGREEFLFKQEAQGSLQWYTRKARAPHKVAESPWLAEIEKGPRRIKGVLLLWAEG